LRFDFKEIPGGTTDALRPVVPVVIEGFDHFPQQCLLDTGSLHNRFGGWLVDVLGVDVSRIEPQRLVVGGFSTEGRSAIVRLQLGDVTWEAPVTFCDPWPLAFHVLGQEGFLRCFDVTIRAARYEIEIAPAV
jgi:hypothetical protein